MKRLCIGMAVVLAGIVGAVVVGSSAEAADRCDDEQGRVLAESKDTVVFARGRNPKFVREPLYYACYRRTGRVVRLNQRDDVGMKRLERPVFALAGRFVAYVQEPNNAGPESHLDQLTVMDLRRRRVREGGEGDRSVTALVVSPRGGAAKVGSMPGPGGTVSHSIAILGSRGELTVADQGTDVAPRSLALGADGRTLYWTTGGQPRSTTLP